MTALENRSSPETERAAHRSAPPEVSGVKWILQGLNVGGLQALRAADNLKFDRLAVVQAAVSICLNGGEMDENVLSGLALDESKAFAGIEPLHCSLFFVHFSFLFSRKAI